MNVLEFSEAFKKKYALIDQYKREVLIEKGDEIKDILKDQQLKGLDKTGGKITPNYKGKYYARKKNKQNSAPGYGTPDLHLSGEMHNKLKLVVSGKNVDYDSKVSYFKYIRPKYDEAFGIIKNNFDKVWKITVPLLLKKLR